jgi:hypothetical protein
MQSPHRHCYFLPVTSHTRQFVARAMCLQVTAHSASHYKSNYFTGVFLSTLAFSYVDEAKRFFPEALTFLYGTLNLVASAPASAEVLSVLLPSFAEIAPAQRALWRVSLASVKTIAPLDVSLMQGPLELTPEIIVSTVNTSLLLAAKFFGLYSSHPCKLCLICHKAPLLII